MQSTRQTAFLTIGTRGSPLALVQARLVRTLLSRAHGVAESDIAIATIKTSGDASQAANQPLREIGGKGLFSKEIESALQDGSIDLAVHSSKDMATRLPDGLEMPVFLEREDVRDAFLSFKAGDLENLPGGAVIGTSSLRRRAQLLHLRPDFRMIEFRGNLDTRIAKLEAGSADATLLAAAGLNRLGHAARITALLDPQRFPPAPAQGAIGVEIRSSDTQTRKLVEALNHAPTAAAIRAERTFLAAIDGSCRTPVGVLTRSEGGRLTLLGELLSPDGAIVHRAEVTGPESAPEVPGAGLGQKLLDMAGPDFIRALKAAP